MTSRPQPGDLVSVTGSDIVAKVDWFDPDKERVGVTFENGSIATVDIGNVKPATPVCSAKTREEL